MEELRTTYAKNRKEWRSWLRRNYKSAKDIWLIYYKKHTGKPRVSYDDAVEEAICFGWIDGKVRSIDSDRFMQRFTPRKLGGNWSTINVARAKKMIKTGQMTKYGLEVYAQGMKEGRVVPSSKDFKLPEDFRVVLQKNQKAWSNFQKFAPSTKLVFVYWVGTAKRHETREARIKK